MSRFRENSRAQIDPETVAIVLLHGLYDRLLFSSTIAVTARDPTIHCSFQIQMSVYVPTNIVHPPTGKGPKSLSARCLARMAKNKSFVAYTVIGHTLTVFLDPRRVKADAI